MKNYAKIIMLLLAAWVLQQCAEDEAARQGKVQFAFSFQTGNAGEGRSKQAVDFPEGSYVLLSVENTAGTVVLDNKKVDLLKIGDNYTTIPVDFSPGSYVLTDFMLLAPDNEVLYAAPKAGSPYAPFVAHPLPLNFSIGKDVVTNLDVEVVSTDAATPEDFGYAAFGVSGHAGPEFSVAVFASDDNANLRFVPARAIVSKNGVVLHTQAILSKTTPLYFDGDPDSTYTLEILKDGYARYVRAFVLQEFLDELDGSPLSVVLTKAFTFEPASQVLIDGLFTARMQGPDGSHLTIDWGDGSVENITFPHDFLFEHTYPDNSNHFVSVTGDIDQLTYAAFHYQDGSINSISLIHLPELSTFTMGYLSAGPSKLNLVENKKLRWFECEATFVTSVDLPVSKDLNHVGVSLNDFSTAAVDKVINAVYHNVTTYSIQSGLFSLYEPGGGYMGPPSAPAMAKLREIRNNYLWTIIPEE